MTAVSATSATSAGPGFIVDQDLETILARAWPAVERLAGCTTLITGGAGFLCSYVVDVLARANDRGLDPPCRVICVDNLATGVASRLRHLEGRSDVTFVHADLTVGLGVDEAAHYVVHGASIASPPWYRKHPLETIDVNVGGTRRLLDHAVAHGARGFLQLSSSEIYGDPPSQHVPTPETYQGCVSSIGPRACYDESKRLGETLCTAYHQQHGLPVKIARPFNVYGPRLRLDDGRVIPDLIRDALNGDPIVLYSDGRVTRSFCYVSDAVVAMLLLLTGDQPGEAFNVGNDEEVTIAHVAELADGLRQPSHGVRHMTSTDPRYLTDNPQRRRPDLTKLRALGYEPQIALAEGLRRTYAHYLEERT